MNDNDALQKLNKLIQDGQSYYQATKILKDEGFSQLQINNATAAMNKGLKQVQDNPKLANSLLAVDQELFKQQQVNQRKKGRIRLLPISPHIEWYPEYVNSWWYIVLLLFAGIAVLYYAFTYVK